MVGDEHARRQQAPHRASDYSFDFETRAGTRAGLGQQIQHYDFYPLPLGAAQYMSWNPAEVLQHLAGLPLVPPPQRFDHHADFFQRSLGLLNLPLRASLRQTERKLMVKEYFHTTNPETRSGAISVRGRRRHAGESGLCLLAR